jgi:hypothetical protein
LVRSAIFVYQPFLIRSNVKELGVAPYVNRLTQQARLRPRSRLPLLILKHIMMITGTTANMSMAVHTTLPVAGQFAVQALNTVSLIITHTDAMVLILRGIPYAEGYRGMCNVFNLPLMLTQGDLENSIGTSVDALLLLPLLVAPPPPASWRRTMCKLATAAAC